MYVCMYVCMYDTAGKDVLCMIRGGREGRRDEREEKGNFGVGLVAVTKLSFGI